MKEIATTQPDMLAVSPIISEVTIPLAIALPEPYLVHFGTVSTLDKFKFLADREWCLKASESNFVHSVEGNCGFLNCRSTFFGCFEQESI